MRLSKILEIIDKNIGNLTVSAQANGSNNHTIDKVSQLRMAINNLSEIEAISDKCNNILGMIPTPGKDSQATVVNATYQNIHSQVSQLKGSLVSLKAMLEGIVKKPEKGQIYFKIPKTNSLSELTKIVEKLSKSLDQLLSITENKPAVKLGGFDTGSEWFILSVDPSALLTVLPFFWAALKVANEKLSFDLKYQEYEDRKADKETRDNFRKTINMLIDGYIKDQAKILIEKNNKNPEDPKHTEDFNRIVNGLKDLSEIFEKGGCYQVPSISNTTTGNESEETQYEKVVSQITENAEKILQLTAPNE